jgi:hypothetical protein
LFACSCCMMMAWENERNGVESFWLSCVGCMWWWGVVLMSEWNNDSWVREGGRHVREGGGSLNFFLELINHKSRIKVELGSLDLIKLTNSQT